jgi:PA14 domain/PKD domain
VLEWTFLIPLLAGFDFVPGSRALLGLLLVLAGRAWATPRAQPVPVPPAMRSTAFTVTVNGKPVDVAHVAASYDFASFDITGPVDVAVTAAAEGFWDRGVDIQPWRLGLRAQRDGQTIRFRLQGPAKLSIARPRDFLNHAQMLFLFAGSPPPPPPSDAQVFKPGVYRQSLNPKSGDTYYLAPGAYFFGSLNLFDVEHVKVLGRGTIVYDGPQDPSNDEGWMQKPDWHCIGTSNAHDIQIGGLTCVIRSRTWSVQMKDSSGFIYDDLRVMGGNPGNANQDGMDWIGSSEGIVRNSFFRASDDVIALMGNWDGYSDADLVRPGKDVHDILVENSELSTSISNIVRAGWPRKIFNSRNFTLRDSDILHAGIGACGQPFGLLGFWGANGAKGDHSAYTFENLFLDDWYSLLQMEQEEPALHGFTFRNIWAPDQPPLLGSTIAGQVSGITLDNVKYGQQRIQSNADVPLAVTDGAAPVAFPAPSGLIARYTVDPPVIAPGQKATFTAEPAAHAHFTWLFGDGTQAHGRKVTHTFADADGTDLDGANGAGRYRVLLHAEGTNQEQDWASKGVVVVAQWHEATVPLGPNVPGLEWRLYPGTWTELPDLSKETAVFNGESTGIDVDPHGFTRYATTWDGYIDVPVDGGYTFHLMARDGARVLIDGAEIAKTGPPFAQVCGVAGNAVRYDRGSIGLRAGLHTLHLEGLHFASQGTPRLLWEGPGLPPADIPTAAFRHSRAVVTAP